jgi:hypothetical protein
MGRSRSRSRSHSSSRSSSSSSDSVDREEREQKEQERREQKAYEKEQRRIAKEQRRAAEEKARIEAAAIEKADSLQWTFSIPPEEGVVLEDPYELTLVAKKKAYMSAAVVDVQEWAALEVYLREKFEVDASIKHIKLAAKVRLDGEIKLRSSAVDATTLGTVLFSIVDLGKLLLDATMVKVTVSIASAQVGKKLKAKAKERTRKQEEASLKWNELKKAIYGSTFSNTYKSGQWQSESSDIMRREHDYMNTFFETRALCEKVMGCEDYHPSPCVLFCPFEGCKKGRYQLNGPGLISQLYSHWQDKAHVGNPAAKELAARWRLALDNKDKDKDWLDARLPLKLSNEEMDHLGGKEQGYQRIRSPTADATDFKPAFSLHTDEHRAWLQATGTI